MGDPKLYFEPAFDPEEALAIVGGDKELFGELAEAFRGSYPGELSLILDAIRLRDAEALRIASHRFKGTLGALAAGPACETANRLEQLGARCELNDAETAYELIEAQVHALDAALAGWI